MAPTRTQDNPVTGITAVVCGLFLFALQDVVIKTFSGEYSVLQIVIVRGVCAVAVVGLVLFARHGKQGFIIKQPLLILNKGLFAFLSYLTYYMAIASLSLADVVAITFSAPILVTVMSALMLREKVDLLRWVAVTVGFAGVLIVVGPSGKIADIAVSFAALAALTYALSTVFARYIAQDGPWTVTFYFSLAHLLGGVIVSVLVLAFGHLIDASHPSLQFLVRPWSTENAVDFLIMMALGVNAALGFYCLNKAYLSAPASKVAPFEYTYIIWAIGFGYMFWSELPAASTLVGVSILIISNLYILHRELTRKRRRRTPPQRTVDQLAGQDI